MASSDLYDLFDGVGSEALDGSMMKAASCEVLAVSRSQKEPLWWPFLCLSLESLAGVVGPLCPRGFTSPACEVGAACAVGVGAACVVGVLGAACVLGTACAVVVDCAVR